MCAYIHMSLFEQVDFQADFTVSTKKKTEMLCSLVEHLDHDSQPIYFLYF